MEEKDVRLEEVQKLKQFVGDHSIGSDNEDHPVKRFIRARIKEIEAMFHQEDPTPEPEPVVELEPQVAVAEEPLIEPDKAVGPSTYSEAGQPLPEQQASAKVSITE